MNLVAEGDGALHVQQSDVSVQVLFPVVFGMNDDVIDCNNLLHTTLKPEKQGFGWIKQVLSVSAQVLLHSGYGLGPIVFAESDQDVVDGEVLVPGRVQDAVGRGEDPLVTDETGPTQQLLRAALIQHHLPLRETILSNNTRRNNTIK